MSAEDFTADEWVLRSELAACFRLLARYRMTDLIYTHATLRLPGAGDRFLINPYGLLFEEITASNLIVVGIDGAVQGPVKGRVNLAGYVIHSAIHAARPDVNCIVHTHTLAGCAVAAQRDGLLPLNQISLEFYGQVAYHDYEGISYELAEQERLVRDLGADSVMILRNHGLLTVGGTVAKAFLRMYYLQKACEIQLAATAGGLPLKLPSDEICRRTERQFREPPAEATAQLVSDVNDENLAWNALKRELERDGASYRD